MTNIQKLLIIPILFFTRSFSQESGLHYYEGFSDPGFNIPQDPNIAASQNSLNFVSNSPTLLTEAPQSKERSLSQPFLVGYEVETFDMFYTKGLAHILKGAIALTQWKDFVIGARTNLQMVFLSMDDDYFDDEYFINFGLGAFAEKDLLFKTDHLAIAGLALDILTYGNAYASEFMLDSRFGAQLSAYGRYNWWHKQHRLVGGAVVQYSAGGKLHQVVLGLTGLYGHKITSKLELIANAQYRFLLFEHYFGWDLGPILNPSQMNIQVGGAWKMSSRLSMELMYKSTLFLDYYDAHTVSLNAKTSF